MEVFEIMVIIFMFAQIIINISFEKRISKFIQHKQWGK